MSRFLLSKGEKYKEKARELEKKARDLYRLFSVSRHPMLAEQYYSDGTPDSAMPLGWSHALRFHVRKMLGEI